MKEFVYFLVEIIKKGTNCKICNVFCRNFLEKIKKGHLFLSFFENFKKVL